MKKQIVLNQDDIRQTIANSLSVGKDKVILEHTYETEGQGMGERMVPVLIAIVEIPMNDQR